MSTPRKILVADDSAVVAAMISNQLKAAGYEVVRAADGIQAAQAAYRERPDLIVLDVFMPRMNGYQVCRLLKSEPAMRHIPVVILTGSDSTGTQFWSLQTGANAFMQKGSEREELPDTVARLLASAPPPEGEMDGSVPDPEELLSKVSLLMDRELYSTTVQRIELQTILQNLSDGIATVDMELAVASVNAALCEMAGAPEEDLLGRPCLEAMGEDAGGKAMALFDELLAAREVSPQDAEILSRVGTALPVAVNVALLTDYLGKTVGSVVLLQDITRRKEVEALVEQLRALDKLKDDLTHMIVHDLRTPLTSLIGGLQTVEELGELNTDQSEFLGIALEGGQSLLSMINDLLDLSKMEDGSMQLEYRSIHPPDLVRRAMQQVVGMAQPKELELVQDAPDALPWITVDEDKMVRTLVNLLGNAIKFTPDRGRITLACRLNEDGRSVTFSVADTGEGIPKEAFTRIFEKFGQVESRKAGRKMSTGLGLTFCKLAAETHGGRIWVESELGVGTTFFLAIPVAPPPVPAATGAA